MNRLMNGRVGFSLLLALVLLFLLYSTVGLHYLARIVPLVVVVPTFLGALAQFIIEVRRALRGEKTNEGEGIDKAVADAAESRARAALADAQRAAPAAGLELTTATVAAGVGQVALPAAGAPPKAAEKKKLTPKELRRGEFIAAAWIVSFVAAIALFGFKFGFPVFMFAFTKIQGRESWKFSIAFAVIFWAVVYVLFVVVMKEILYPGLIPDALGW